MIKYYGNGKVFTGVGEDVFVSAFGVEDGRFVWVGDTKDIPGEYEDLKGATVTPGFIDSHMHPLIAANLVDSVALMPPTVTSIEDMIREMKKIAEVTPEGEWIKGWGWDEVQFKEKRYPNRHDLDKISTKHPVQVKRSCFHSISLNTYALNMFNIDKDTPEIPNGKIFREADGTPDGYLQEEASRLVIFDERESSNEEKDIENLVKISKRFAKYGITSVVDMAALASPLDSKDIYKKAGEQGFSQRINLFYLFKNLEDNKVELKATTDPEEKVRVTAIKMLTDGSMSSHTAYMKEPYPGTDDRGFPVEKLDDLKRGIEYARKHNLQLSVHAMGDAAIQLVVDAFAGEKPWIENAPSCRIEHCSLTDDKMIEDIANAKIGASSHTIFYYAEYDSYKNNLDEERMKNCYRVKSIYNKLDYLALGSDCPATTWAEAEDIFTGIKSATHRVIPKGFEYYREEEITIPQAVLLYTKKSAQLCNMPEVGEIKEGYLADFVILKDDIFEMDPSEVDKAKVDRTFVGGKEIYRA